MTGKLINSFCVSLLFLMGLIVSDLSNELLSHGGLVQIFLAVALPAGFLFTLLVSLGE